ncbi:MAG: hypothetical protein H0W12_03435 [Chitinophagaceae bacterium]|nr:hypothetical protein [Chitinophagaceae bacterium]
MKNLLLLLLFIPFATFAQVHIGTGAGYSTDDKALAKLNVGYQLSQVNVDAELRTTSGHNYYGAKIGFNIVSAAQEEISGFSIIPSVGYFYQKVNIIPSPVPGKIVTKKSESSDQYNFAYSIKGMKQISNDGALFLEGMYINKIVQVTFGIQFRFGNFY